MKRIAALILCLIMICSCCFVQAFADEAAEAEQTEAVTETATATVIIPEAPLCLGYADNGAVLEVLDDSGDYTKVRSADGVEGYADARWLTVFKVSGAAKVSAARAEIFAEMLKQGDTVEVIERGDEVTKVKANDVEGEIETRFLRFADEEEYQSKTVYTAPDTKLYDNPYLRGSATWLKKNTELTVLADLGSCYYVKNDSIEGYIAKDFALTGEVDYTVIPNPYVIEIDEEEKHVPYDKYKDQEEKTKGDAYDPN